MRVVLVERVAHVVARVVDVFAFEFDEVVRVDERVGVHAQARAGVLVLLMLLFAWQAQKLQPLLLGESAYALSLELFVRAAVAVVVVVAFVRVKRAAWPLVAVRGPVE